MINKAKVTVSSESHTKHINVMQSEVEFLNVKTGGPYSNRQALKKFKPLLSEAQKIPRGPLMTMLDLKY
jgi:hypothetical protein